MLGRSSEHAEDVVQAASPLTAAPARGTALRRVRVQRGELLVRPDGDPVGSVRLGQPVETLGRPTTAGWQRIRTDTGDTGWVRASVLGAP